MKQALAVLWQAVVLYIAALLGFVLGLAKPGLRVTHELSRTATLVRTYDFDWLIAAVLMYLLLLAVAALRGRLRQRWLGTTAALLITVLSIVVLTQLGVQETAL